MTPDHPCIGFFPALPLASNIELGAWVIGTPDANVLWRSDRFRILTKRLLRSFAKEGFRESALVWHRDRGFDGEPPPSEAAEAIQLAIRFAVLDANDHVHRDGNAGHLLATSENAALYIQPIDEKAGRLTLRQGGVLKKVLLGGLRIGQRPPSLPDAVVPIEVPVRASRKLANAVFDAIAGASSSLNAHMRIAIEWHAAAMANPKAVSMQQRLIALKTGFEALLGTSKSRKCAQLLRAKFEQVTLTHRTLLPWAGIVWSPSERTDLIRTYREGGKTKAESRSELEDWFMTLAAARNSIIHDGVLSIEQYEAPPERPLSAYKGHLFWTGDRLLREAIKASLGVEILLCGRLAQWARLRPYIEAIRGDLASEDAPPVEPLPNDVAPATVDDSTEGGRSLRVLLELLGCNRANEVLIRRSAASVSASEAVAREMARRQGDAWVANVAKTQLLISSAERALLKRNGAEDAPPFHVEPCD